VTARTAVIRSTRSAAGPGHEPALALAARPVWLSRYWHRKISVVKIKASVLRLVTVVALASSTTASGETRTLSAAEIDRLVTRTMSAFAVPGIAVGVVKDGRLVHAKGYGVRELGHPETVDLDTGFAIGSISKSFTTAALAILIDEGKLHWDDRVIDYLPEFRMADPFVTREFTIRDLLTHRSGLGTGAGDLLFVTPTDFTRQDLLHALRYLKPVTSFRSQFAYDNLLYVVAGEVIATVSGMSWEDFVTKRVLGPLGMTSCAAAFDRLHDRVNIAAPHAVVDGKLGTVARLEIPLVGAAGGIQCNITGMARYVAAQLAHGRTADGVPLFSAAQAEEMWSAQIPLPPGGRLAELTRTHFAAYGLGWGLDDFNGYKRISHNGGLPGMVTHVSMLPELGVGVIVLTNQQEGFALAAIATQILEAYAAAPRHDWVALTVAARAERLQKLHARESAAPSAATVADPVAPQDLDAYVGTFADPWRGPAAITRGERGLRLTFSHTTDLSGDLTQLGPGFFIVRWDDRSLNADAYVRFTRDFGGKVTGFTMKAASAATDFSFDFQDLDFSRAPSDAARPSN
jgi:CubicO group peptidase (beta-lactamase class C family)